MTSHVEVPIRSVSRWLLLFFCLSSSVSFLRITTTRRWQTYYDPVTQRWRIICKNVSTFCIRLSAVIGQCNRVVYVYC